MALLTVNEVAKLLHVNPRHVRWLIQTGKLPAGKVQLPGVNRYYYQVAVSDLRRYRDGQQTRGAKK